MAGNFSNYSSKDSWLTHHIYPVVAIWGLLFTFSFIGNICVCVVSCRRHHILGIKTYYFTSLAIADLIFTLSTLFYVLNVVLPVNIYSDFSCKLFYYAINTSHGASVLNLLLLTYNRYCAVISPFKVFSNRNKNGQVVRKVFLTWAAALVPYIPLLFIYKVGAHDKQDGTSITEKQSYCSQSSRYGSYIATYYGLLVIFMYLIPLFLIVVAYSRICVRLSLNTYRYDSMPTNRCRSKAVKLLIVVATLFFVLWTPFNTMLVIIFVFRYEFRNLQLVWALSTMLVLLNASINPWLYLVVGRRAINRRALTPVTSPAVVRIPMASI